MMRVFEGGVGWLSGGRLERSIDILARDEREVGRDDSGVDNEDIWKSERTRRRVEELRVRVRVRVRVMVMVRVSPKISV